MTRQLTCASALAIALVVLLSVPAEVAAQNPTVTTTIVPGTTSPQGLMPGLDGSNYVYQYTITDGQSVTDTIPVQLCVTAHSGTWISFKVSFGSPAGSLASGVTVPADTTFASATLGTLPSCTTVSINVLTGALNLANPSVSETREANINISYRNTDPTRLNPSPNAPNVKIRVTINPATNDTACFTTDSSGNLLADCDGLPVTVSGGDAGRFAIVVNKKKNLEVATNPGQFYYNILWENKTGSEQTVTVSMALNGVLPKGAQAIHAWAFPPPFSGVSMADFETVNDGIPGGSDGVIENIIVPAGWTLWVNYHLEWAGLGGPAPDGCATTCETANQTFSVVGAISGGVSRTCGSGAKGYKK